jgi:hypothetical protein
MCHNGSESAPLTLTEPNGARSLPFPFTVAASANPKLYLPSFLFCIVQVRAKVSSVWAVTISSQSFDLADEYESEVIGGNLSEARGMDRFVAFLARDPERLGQSPRLG